MIFLNRALVQSLLALALVCFCQAATAQAPDVSFPKASSGFSAKVTYAARFDDVWPKIVAALSDNGFQIASASKDAMQISTGYKTGPAQKESSMAGALLSQYKYVVSVIAVSPTQTRVNIAKVRTRGGA